MSYALLALSIGLSVLNSGVNNRFCKSPRWTPAAALLVNCLSCLVAACVLFVLSRGVITASPFTVCLGILFGIITALSLSFNLAALSSGPMNLTVMLVSCAMLIPALAGPLVWHEAFVPEQGVGLGLMTVSFLICFSSRSPGNRSPRWHLFTLGAFLGSGCIGVLQKIHQTSVYHEELDGFLFAAFVSGACVLGLVLLGKRLRAAKPAGDGTPLRLLLTIAPVNGICTALINKLNLYLSGVLPGILFFPLVNGGVILLSILASRVLFHEKMTPKQVLGVVLGVLSIFLIGNWWSFLLNIFSK